MKEKTCIIFDMDGTIWDASDAVIAAGNEIIEKTTGRVNHLNQEIMNQVMGLQSDEIAKIYFPWLPENEGLKLCLECMNNENRYLAKHGAVLYDHVLETLQKLSEKYDLMIVTNAQDGYVDAMFEYYPMRSYFKDYETFGHTLKPKGENIRLIMERNGYEKAVYIGDTLKDYEACQYANIPMVFASYGCGTVENYWKKIDSFQELEDIFL